MVDESYDISLLANLPDQTLEDIVGAIKDGANTAAGALGFEEPALNAVERMALGYYRARHYDKAAVIYGFLLRMNPERSSAWRGLGACAHAQKSYAIAARCYEEAAELNYEDVVAQVFWGECLCQVGEQEAGLKLLNAIVHKDTPDVALKPYIARAKAIVAADGGMPARIVVMNQGKSLAAQAQRVLAEDGFDPLPGSELAFDPDREISPEDILNNPELKGIIQELKTAVEKGQVTYKDIGGFTDNELDGAYGCACKYAEMGQLLEAIQIGGYLMFLDPYDGRFHQLVGICLQRMKQYEVAEHYYRMALTCDKDNPMTLVYMGECKIMAGQIDDGVQVVKDGAEVAANKPEHQEIADRAAVLLKQFSA